MPLASQRSFWMWECGTTAYPTQSFVIEARSSPQSSGLRDATFQGSSEGSQLPFIRRPMARPKDQNSTMEAYLQGVFKFKATLG